MKNPETILHVRGESRFVDDRPTGSDVLHIAVFGSPAAHGRILKLDVAAAMEIAGVVRVFTAKDIPGENQIGNIIQDEKLLADGEVDYIGRPIAFVAAVSPEMARRAVKAIKCEIEELPAVFDPREAQAKGQLIAPPRIFSLGDTAEAWQNCEVIVEGRADSGGQEHAYLETQSSLAFSGENGAVKILTATQSPTLVQKMAAQVLGLPMHKVEVDVLRLGGGFGGKEEQATAWACMAALAAFRLKRPAKIVLNRREDMAMTGKRHPYSSDFRIGLAKDGSILALEVTYYQNAGATADLSTAVLERTLFHAASSYYIPNVKATAYSCRTNLPPNTACRGFGAPQAVFVMEAAIFKAAEKMGIDPAVIQQKNLLKEGDEFLHGMKNVSSQAVNCWKRAFEKYEVGKIESDIREFNAANPFQKKGMALIPICYGISFTAIHLNQAGALVHVYTDGSVSISTAAVEKGQGVNWKMARIAAQTFSVKPERIKIETTNTARIANTSPTAASATADMNGHAVMIACREILGRLFNFAAGKMVRVDPASLVMKDEILYADGGKTEWDWQKLVAQAYLQRINLSAHAHYATPGIYFDKTKEKGIAFAYHVFGTAVVETTLDCLRGVYKFDAVRIVHDFGRSLDPMIDRGQVEGALAQGLGWMTIEELTCAKNGRLLNDSFSTYKVPDIYSVPGNIDIDFLENADNPKGPFNSKAVGEPPLLYGIAGYFAIRRAMKAFRPDLEADLFVPLTPEKVLLALYGGQKK